MPVSNNPEVANHYATQAGLSAALLVAIRRLKHLLGGRDVDQAMPVYQPAVEAVVDRFSQAAISLNYDYYQALRDRAGVTDAFSPPVVDLPPVAKKRATLSWATSVTDAVEIQRRVEAGSQKLVMDAGRDQVAEAMRADPKARGWARVTRPGACAFCRMLGTRGAIYHTSGTAGRNANVRFSGAGEFKYHNDCQCFIEPLFGHHYELTAHARADLALWRDSTSGYSGQDAINAFRRAVTAESRPENSPV